MSAIENLRNRINLTGIPFTDRGSRLLLFREGGELFIRLVERWVRWENKVGHYRKRPPYIERFRFLDGDGEPLEFTTETFPHVTRLTTPSGTFDWVFWDTETIVVRLPAGSYGFRFVANGDKGATDWRGGTVRGVRNFAYTTSARVRENIMEQAGEGLVRVHLMLEASEGDALVLNITPRLGFNRCVPDPSQVIEEARARWQAWFDAAPPVRPEYRSHYEYAWWVMRAGLLSQRFYFTREAMTPSKIHYVGVWHWDQFFHALAYRHVDRKLAEDQIRIITDHQRDDGMLPDAVHDEGTITHLEKPVDADVTKPPLGAWAVMKVYEKTGSLDFLKEMYEPLVRWHRWWWDYNHDGDGLCEYRHPFSSGLDDSPLWDHGMPVTAPDLNTYLYIQKESLAQMATLIGRVTDAATFRAEAQAMAERVHTRLWDDKRGVFMALQRGTPVPVLSLFNLMPLWMNTSPQEVIDRVLAHLNDPEEFASPYPLPTIALNDPSFDPMQMWRGPAWMNINYMFIEMLFRIGEPQLARSLRRQTLDLIMKHTDIYEYYNPITAERPPKAAPIFGWTSAVFIDLAIQESEDAR
jgi:hypothetical protein